jgi:hypothetical protein
MAALSGDYTGCIVSFYDASKNHLGSTIVTYYNRILQRIEVKEIPPAVNMDDDFMMLILTSPSPCEYHGKIKIEGKKIYIGLFRRKERENRGATRYRVDCSALIENFVCEGKGYLLHTPLEIKLINISKSGARFSAPNYALLDGDIFQMRMKISKSDKLLIAEVINHQDKNADITEYGCSFLKGNEKVV